MFKDNFLIALIEYYLCTNFHDNMMTISKVVEGGVVKSTPTPVYLRPKKPGTNRVNENKK